MNLARSPWSGNQCLIAGHAESGKRLLAVRVHSSRETLNEGRCSGLALLGHPPHVLCQHSSTVVQRRLHGVVTEAVHRSEHAQVP